MRSPNNVELIEKVIPFFDKYRLRAIKLSDYLLWKEAVKLIQQHNRKAINAKKGLQGFTSNPWLPEEHEQLLKLQERMIGVTTTKKVGKWQNRNRNFSDGILK